MEQELSYERELSRRGQEVELSVGWEYEEEETDEQVREISDREGTSEEEQQRAISREIEEEWELEVEYTHPFGNDRRLRTEYEVELGSHSKKENQSVQLFTEESGKSSFREIANDVSLYQSVQAGFIEYDTQNRKPLLSLGRSV